MPPVPLSRSAAVLLYDGTCGFCATSVQWVLQRDRRKTLCFAALQGETARPILARHPELANVDSVVWVETDEAHGADKSHVLVRSEAALAVGRYLGGGWSVAARLGTLVPPPLRDWGYDLIARHRHKLTRNGPECLLPAPEERKRFLP
jgi:predicted DCC family thiol-disulfide oxidoreductase YuxK